MPKINGCYTTITKGAFDHIESEIRNYDYTLKEIEILEQGIFGDDKSANFHNGTRLVQQAKYNHLIEVLKSINKAFEELSEDQKKVVESIYRSNQHKELTPTEEKCRNDFVERIALLLGWR